MILGEATTMQLIKEAVRQFVKSATIWNKFESQIKWMSKWSSDRSFGTFGNDLIVVC